MENAIKKDLALAKEMLRLGKTLEYKGWTLTARKKFLDSPFKDNRIWITAAKDEMKDEDDTLSYLLQRIDEKK